MPRFYKIESSQGMIVPVHQGYTERPYLTNTINNCPVVAAHTFNLSTQEAEASLVFRASSRTARPTEKNLVSKKQIITTTTAIWFSR